MVFNVSLKSLGLCSMIKAIESGGILDCANVSLLSWTCRIIIFHATQIKYIGEDKNECKNIDCLHLFRNKSHKCVCVKVYFTVTCITYTPVLYLLAMQPSEQWPAWITYQRYTLLLELISFCCQESLPISVGLDFSGEY